jgi:hypothetical protein
LRLSPILVQYLIENNQLPLQGIGNILLDASSLQHTEAEKGIYKFPEGSIQFELDRSTPVSATLIAYVSTATGKIKPLAASDLESFFVTGIQLLNISKPFMIEGLGTFNRESNGEFIFEPLGYLQLPVEDSHARKKKEHTRDNPDLVSFDENILKPMQEPANGAKKWLIAISLILGLGIIAWVAWYFLSQTKNAGISEVPTTDTSGQYVAVESIPADSSYNLIDSNQTRKDSLSLTSSYVVTDSTYDVIIESLPKVRAFKRTEALRSYGHNVKMETSDSITFKLFIPIKGNLADTTRMKDSLGVIFGKKPSIRL